MNNLNKRFIVFIFLMSMFITNIFGVYMQKTWVSAKTNTKKYHVKEKYLRDLGKKFKVFKKKYGWTLTNGGAPRAAQFEYQIPNKKIWYTFQGYTDTSTGEWKMRNDIRCIRIHMKAKMLIKGFKEKMKINKFVSKLDSKKKKASWSEGNLYTSPALVVKFYAKNGQKYKIYKEIADNDRWISANDWVDLVKVY